MKTHLNTLFVTLEGSYLRKDGAAVEIRHEGETRLRVPLHNLDGIAAFGWDITVSKTGTGTLSSASTEERAKEVEHSMDLTRKLKRRARQTGKSSGKSR